MCLKIEGAIVGARLMGLALPGEQMALREVSVPVQLNFGQA